MADYGFSAPYAVECQGATGNAVDLFYPYSAIHDWIKGDRDRRKLGYPGDVSTHLYHDRMMKQHWFAEAYTCKHLDPLGFDTWNERCQLQRPLSSGTDKTSLANPEVFLLLGSDVVNELQTSINSCKFEKWGNPDVIARHRDSGNWLFLECKRVTNDFPELGIRKGRDRLHSHQILSLGLLESTVPHSTALTVYVKPEVPN